MSRDRIVQMPKGFLILRVLQLILAVISVGLLAFLIANTIGFIFSSTAFAIFCGGATMIIVSYMIIAERAAPAAYNKWAILGLEIFMVVCWLSSMAALAALRASFTVEVDIYYKKRSLIKRYIYTWAGNTYLALLATAGGVAALEMILFIISLIIFSIRLHRHRQRNPSHSRSNVPDETAWITTKSSRSEKIELQQSPPPSYNLPSPALRADGKTSSPSSTRTADQTMYSLMPNVKAHHAGDHDGIYPVPSSSPPPHFAPAAAAPFGVPRTPPGLSEVPPSLEGRGYRG